MGYEQLYSGVYGTSRLLEFFVKNNVTVVHVVRVNQIERFVSVQDAVGNTKLLRQEYNNGSRTTAPEYEVTPKLVDASGMGDKERYTWISIVHFEKLMQVTKGLNHVTVIYERLIDPVTTEVEFDRLRKCVTEALLHRSMICMVLTINTLHDDQ